MRTAIITLLIRLTTTAAHGRVELRRRINLLRQQPDAGYTNETVVITALLVAGAVLTVSVIIAKVTAKARSIDLGP
jgi:hypothetical protein